MVFALFREQLLDVLSVSTRDGYFTIEATGALRGLVLHEVVTVRLTTTDLARSRNREALGRAAVCLHLRHDGLSFDS